MSPSFINGFSRSAKKTVQASMYWGDGHDGILTEGRTLHAGVDFMQYQEFAVLEYERIHWDPVEPEILTVDQPCRGLVIFVQGNVYIGQNATISMAKKGSILPCNPEEILKYSTCKQMRDIAYKLRSIKGGAGGDGGNSNDSVHLGGTANIGRICQGGLGAGGAGSRYGIGGTGAEGGSIIYPEILGYGGHPNNNYEPPVGKPGWQGGGGGAGVHADGKGGGGHPFGAGGAGGSHSTIGGDGEHTGGFILIVTYSNISILGTLDVTGGDGGSNLDGSDPGGGGGGAGGGVIAIFAKGSINTSAADIRLDGGAGGTGYQDGAAGGQGTFYSEKI